MKIKDILSVTDFEEVARQIELHYGNKHTEKFRELYDRLKNSDNRCSCNENFSIIIKVFSETQQEEYELTESFDENDTSLYFDVSAINDNDDFLYSIAGIDKYEFPEYDISPKTLKLFSPSAILAHCLWEITFFHLNKQKGLILYQSFSFKILPF
ncbi:MAG: hypothetical protein K2I80_10685 [Ruminococcus sp.]|nr:hypothetical protein [Ruminococcus sp.]